ncbi:MAG: 2OG-Fe dioxygenase family protein [Candidatus Obscuribacterales bacterium]|nr:2OG-Fe dioxygenase family protein [Candidatus Obscuribacterales bacterium]
MNYRNRQKITYPSRISSDLNTLGFSLIKKSELSIKLNSEDALADFQEQFHKAPPDGPHRKRFYSSYIMVPNGNTGRRPQYLGSHFQQSAAVNPEQKGTERRFHPIPKEIERNKLFQELIKADIAAVCLSDSNGHLLPVHVEVHLISLTATSELAGIATPNCPHKDLDFAFFLHLIDKKHVDGGESVLYANDHDERGPKPGQEIFRTTLEEGDTLAVNDSRVWHHVTPVTVTDGHTSGYRNVLIVGITPMLQGKMGLNGAIEIDNPEIVMAA